MNKANILGVEISDVSKSEALAKVRNYIFDGYQHYIVTPNPEIVLSAREDENLRTIINHADLALPDGFGLKIIYYDKFRNEKLEEELGIEYKELEDVLRTSDFISVHVPLLPETEHLIGEKEIGLMKKTAYLINTSRGPIIDEKALVEALKTKTIKGAALDVFEKEPELMPGLAELDNVILTPHIASGTEEARNKMSQLAGQGIIDILSGKTPDNLVKI